MYTKIVKSIKLDDGREITIETGKLAKQANGSVVVRMNDTMLLATVVSAQEIKSDIDFMPLSVEYKEKYAAIGRIPGGFLKREARPSDNEILISRLVDRVLRPLFPADFHAETFVTITLISAEEDTKPDALAGLAASAALAVSDIPFNGPISEVRVAKIDEKLTINPSRSELEKATLNIMVGASYDNVMMVEGEMNEVSEEELIEAIKYAHDNIKQHCKVQMELAEATHKTQKREYKHEEKDEHLQKQIKEKTYDKIYAIAKAGINDRNKRNDEINKVKEQFIEEQYTEEELLQINKTLISKYFKEVQKEAIRNCMLNEKIRLDGRKTDEIRPIWSEIDCLPSAHGSSIFTRGETQSLTTVTLGSKTDEKIIDDALFSYKEKFTLHYNFPPFSTGDARPVRAISRREIGHGNLAHRALKNMLPEDNSYTIRIVSDILESNGSSSMATVCAGTLALMDAGIKIKKPVSGIAMGLVTDTKSNKFAILSDILGDEDHLGDMDFKVTGTEEGITAAQMDIKVDGLPYEVLQQALAQAREGRLHILRKIEETIAQPRDDFKPHAPRIEKVIIPKDMIGTIIGPGGKKIQKLQEDTNTIVTIEEKDNTGIVEIASSNKEDLQAAKCLVEKMIEIPEAGKTYEGLIKTITDFGAFVEILPGTQGLLHISEINWTRIEKVEDVLKEGEKIEVKLLEVDKRSGKLKLSRKALLPRP